MNHDRLPPAPHRRTPFVRIAQTTVTTVLSWTFAWTFAWTFTIGAAQAQGPRPPPPPFAGGAPLVLLHSSALSGQTLRVDGPVENLARRAFNDAASDIDVLAGTWELCSNAGYGGQCQRFGPGRHRLPPALRDRLSSLRPVGPGGPAARPPVSPRHRAITLYDDIGGRGPGLRIDGTVTNLQDLRFNDRAASVQVHSGRWLLCQHADFGGRCQEFGPGRHRLPRGLAGELSSLRPLR